MSLYEKLQQSSSEEDVKDLYIKALGLKAYKKNLIDIQTDEIWFEAKDGFKHSSYEMFTQLLHYIQHALDRGEPIPPLLCVIDTRKAAIMKTSDALPLLQKKTIKWGKSASQFPQEALDIVSAYIGTYFVSFNIETHEEEFISTIKQAIKSWDIIRTQITPDNLKQVFDKWTELIGREVREVREEDYSLLFFADIMSDGTQSTHDNLPAELLHKNNSPVFSLAWKIYELGNKEGYRRFWSIYDRPPKAEYRNYLLERRDSLIPLDERSFKWAYYTPLHVVDKAYDLLAETLGKNWQREYIVWDMCCGVGNLEVKHGNHRNIFMSTLDQADIDVMKATKTCVAATRFQYDYLNDDITDDGRIDYSLTNKVPQALRDAIASGKKILVLINPPYGEASSSSNAVEWGWRSKTWIAYNQMMKSMDEYWYARRELFTQFVVRIAREIPNVTLAMFSTLKYVNASNFEVFRTKWNAEYLNGFIVHSKAFDGINGNFPIWFLVWKTKNNLEKRYSISEISTEIFDKNWTPIWEKKFFNSPTSNFLNNSLLRLKTDSENIPLKNAIEPQLWRAKVIKWLSNAIWYFWCNGNDLQQANQTVIFSSVFSAWNGFYITKESISQVWIMFSVRRLIKPTWINNRDQFLQPNCELPEVFQDDCLVWMLFNGSNLTASADGLEWGGKKWSIVNHFIPFSEQEVGANDRFESDFMYQYMQGKKFSSEAKAVLESGKKLWSAYYKYTDNYAVREEYKLNRVDVGWYQIRNALKKRNESGDYAPVSFTEFEASYKELTEKLRPLVYEYGFLKN